MTGQCRFCRCSEDRACRLETGETCHWTDAEQTLCSNPKCLVAADRARRAADRAIEETRREAVQPIRQRFVKQWTRRKLHAARRRPGKPKGWWPA
jgi:hypothetical protein